MASLGIQSVYSANPYDQEMISRGLNKIYNWKFTPSRFKCYKKIALLELVKSFLLDLKIVKNNDYSNKQVMNIDIKNVDVIKI